MQINKSHSGISLLEILFVIAIIALIASISIPVYSNYTIRSKISNQLSFMGAIKQDVSNSIINGFNVSTITIDDLHMRVDEKLIFIEILVALEHKQLLDKHTFYLDLLLMVVL